LAKEKVKSELGWNNHKTLLESFLKKIKVRDSKFGIFVPPKLIIMFGIGGGEGFILFIVLMLLLWFR
jgi:hypothetical protein